MRRQIINNLPFCWPVNITDLSSGIDNDDKKLNTIINNHISNYTDLRFLFHPEDPIRYAFFQFTNNNFENNTKQYKQKLLQDLINNGTMQLNFDCSGFNNTVTEQTVVGNRIANSQHIDDIDNLYDRIANNNIVPIFIRQLLSNNSCVDGNYIFDFKLKEIINSRGVQLPALLNSENTPSQLEYIIAPFRVAFKNTVYIGLDAEVTFTIEKANGAIRRLTVPIFSKQKRVYIEYKDIIIQYLITQKYGYNNIFTKQNYNKYTQQDTDGFAKLSIGEDNALGLFRSNDMLNTDEIIIIPTTAPGDRPLFNIDPLDINSPERPRINAKLLKEIVSRLRILFDNRKNLISFLNDNNNEIVDVSNASAPLTPEEIDGCIQNNICISNINYSNVQYYIYNPILKSHLDTHVFNSQSLKIIK